MEALEKWMIIRITLCQTNTLPKWMSFLNHFFNSSLPLNDYSAAFKYRSPSQQRRPSPSLLSDSYSMPLHVTSLRLKVKTSWLLFNSSKKKMYDSFLYKMALPLPRGHQAGQHGQPSCLAEILHQRWERSANSWSCHRNNINNYDENQHYAQHHEQQQQQPG